MSTLDTVSIDRVQRTQLIREAEGYLDLIMVFDDRWPLDLELKKQVSNRILKSLSTIRKPLGHKPYILFLKGQACLASERFKEAIHHLKQAAQLDAENIHVHIALAWCHKRVGELGLAVSSIQEAIRLDSSSAIAHYNLACYLALKNDASSAIMHLTIAFDLNPDFRSLIPNESDFDPIRDDPGFQAATSLIV